MTFRTATRVDGSSMGTHLAVAAKKGAVTLEVGKFRDIDVVFIEGPTVKMPVKVPFANVASFG